MDEMTPTQLRADLFRAIDRVLETGQALRVVRGDRAVLILPEAGPRLDLDRLPRRSAIVGDPDDLVAISWEWKPE